MKNYREEARPPFFSNKPRLTPEQRGATGKGPLPKPAVVMTATSP